MTCDDITTYMGTIDLDLALVVARTIRPAFVEVRGCVLLTSHYDPANFEQWWNATQGNHRQIEAVINHIHLSDDLSFEESEASELSLVELGKLMQDSWQDALDKAFPSRQFEVSFTNNKNDHGPIITFCSKE